MHSFPDWAYLHRPPKEQVRCLVAFYTGCRTVQDSLYILSAYHLTYKTNGFLLFVLVAWLAYSLDL